MTHCTREAKGARATACIDKVTYDATDGAGDESSGEHVPANVTDVPMASPSLGVSSADGATDVRDDTDAPGAIEAPTATKSAPNKLEGAADNENGGGDQDGATEDATASAADNED